MSQIELYERPSCPYCAKVRRKLDELDVDYVSNEVPPARFERDRVEELSGQTGVPVIVDEEHGVEGMAESSDIVDYLEETYGDGATA